ncbi:MULTISPECIES: hypothetical protein [Sorangium]|uniref:Secreted protein n=1 Tax=Sorangium cellulosum TaxID=56 RepID=A0A4P2R528_SORCE|nr:MULTISPECIES: hypothetical protein [Sorangium]AUX37868.1 hypothetical protein SOCE836_101040 [Sorangium cellulosum]WCQ97157.1 hypothetical protein NQZ70_09948 [Sorangium sp. Soce836]
MRTTSTKSTVLLCLALVAPLCACFPEPPPTTTRDVKEVAKNALSTLEQLVSEENYKRLGFRSLDEVRRATIGEPLPVSMVRFDELAEYQRDQDPRPLIHPTPQTFAPVLVDGEVRSSMIVHPTRVDGTLTVGGFGGPALIRALETARRQSIRQTGRPASDYFDVEVSALLRHFVAYREENQVLLIPIFDDDRLDFRAGQTMRAQDVFARLVPEALRDMADKPS